MKFIHTADWHLGKLVHGIYMTEEQEYILQALMKIIDRENPDAVVIAGDLYDRSVPPTDAVELLNKYFYEINVVRNIPILAISGNHDSGERLAFGSTWYRKNHLYIEGKLGEHLFQPISIKGVNFYLMPYMEPGIVRNLYDDDTIHSHEDAMKRLVGKMEETIQLDVPNIFIGHAFVAGGKTTESERTLSVGGSGMVSVDSFSPFAYTALGHLHSPDAIKHPTIKYSGSLLKYSFSESTQRKIVRIVEIDENSNLSEREEKLIPKRDMREISGYMDELLDPQYFQSQNVEDYIKVILKDEGSIIDPMNKLRQIYPNILHLERKIDLVDAKEKQTIQQITERKNELELFKQFYEDITTAKFTDEKEKIMIKTIDKVKKEEGIL
ncbi:exonuclease SbcCD subunit D [Caldibacillus lycopersici]|uniref:Nuclease SbcCD subunit D n=1 Tax=Perspicuibacillus lycopersici TaxID=1325689 RepID=A0AAE3LL43_9BACI|nr:exonuclease SbcCD subunit D [Perspicuibacillus lycopersici]MCU9611950.1 exonuclease SbcCD subunit D [Perspicuibacillus lycopersici]